MTRQTFTKEQFWKELEAKGEKQVRIDLQRGFYGNPMTADRYSLACQWLRKIEQEHLLSSRKQSGAVSRGQIRLAPSAKNAAWIIAIVVIAAVILSAILLF
jgi:hypothetical protein